MGASVSFTSLEDAWLYRRAFFEVILYHSVISNSSREKLPTLYPDVEREIDEHLHDVDPIAYPEPIGSLGLIVFDRYPLEERREFLRATKLGVEEIRTMPEDGDFNWTFESKHIFVTLGEELIELMEASLQAEAAQTGEGVSSNAP